MAEFSSWLQPTKADYYTQRLSVHNQAVFRLFSVLELGGRSGLNTA
jgi:hypothetical protein